MLGAATLEKRFEPAAGAAGLLPKMFDAAPDGAAAAVDPLAGAAGVVLGAKRDGALLCCVVLAAAPPPPNSDFGCSVVGGLPAGVKLSWEGLVG